MSTRNRRASVRGSGHTVRTLAIGVVGSALALNGFAGTGAGVAAAASVASSHSSRIDLASATHRAITARHRAHHAGTASPAIAASPRTVQPDAAGSTLGVDATADVLDADPATACAAGNADTCTLRDAVADANADSGNTDEVSIPSGTDIVLSQGVIALTNSMLISGAGATVDGGAGSGIFSEDTSGISVEIDGLTLTDSASSAVALTVGGLTLSGLDVTGNTSKNGAGVDAEGGELWVSDCTFTDDTATNEGGALYFNNGSQQVEGTTIGGSAAADGNTAPTGAGIANENGTATVTDSTISNNTSGTDVYGYGVGLYNDNGMDVTNTVIDDNTATGGGEGAGLYNEYDLTAINVTVDGNAISGSSSAYGAGISSDGTTQLASVKVDHNTTSSTSETYGGAVYSDGRVFSWQTGTAAGTKDTAPAGSTTSIYGGAVYLDSDLDSLTGVKVSGTTSTAGAAGSIEGGGIYADDDTVLSKVSVAATVDRAGTVEGGAVANDEEATMQTLTIAGTTVAAASTSGGQVEGGVIYNSGYLTLSSVSVTTTKVTASDGSSTASATGSLVTGGIVYTDDEMSAQSLSSTGGSVQASGGDGAVDGGAVYNDDDLNLFHSQFVGVGVTADLAVEGGVVDNVNDLIMSRVSLVNDTVTVLGGPDVSTAPEADGSLLYSNYGLNLVNVTIAGDSSSVPSTGSYDYGLDFTVAPAQLTNTTIAGNTLTGPAGATDVVSATGSAEVSLLNTIVASSDGSTNCATSGGTIVSTDNSLDSGSSCGFTGTGDLSNTDPLVAAPAFTGTQVYTAALKSGSPAIGTGSTKGSPHVDARGIKYASGVCNIGAW